MAKLNAGGRQELARMSKEWNYTEDVDATCSWERRTYVLMSDRTILKKIDVIFRADNRRHSYGWKKYGVIKEGVTTEKWVESYRNIGFTRE